MSEPTIRSALPVDPAGGALHGGTGQYRKVLSELAGVYRDDEAYRDRLRREDPVMYRVAEYRRSTAAGDVIFGTSTLLPGRIGREFSMTRGHRHRLGDRTELYYGLSGHGVLLLDGPEGAEAVEMRPHTAAYVPPHTLHRTVNVGSEPFVTLFCYPADAGQDYAVIEAAHGMRWLVVAAPDGGWTLEGNPDHVSGDE